ncbi:MAG TPA: FliH/SctL family protein [Burkholderiaceae bacterium]|nr:FliH/SctL family protein [Burkholderiaceae bacterium]
MTKWSKTSAYSRFIPSEEIDAVAEWRFDNVDGTPHVVQVEPQLPPGPTPEEVAEQVATAREQAYAEGYAEGHAQGLAEGSQATRDELAEPMRLATEANKQRIDAVLDSLRVQLEATQDQMAQAVLHMAVNLARQVIRRELALDPLSVQPVVREAMALLHADNAPVSVRLNPEDIATIKEAIESYSKSDGVKYISDSSITPGGCMVDTAGAGVDATVETRWARAVANLGLSTAWEAPDAAD